MKNKPTITIGIPLYNEAQNIGYLLKSIRKQRRTSFRLKKILVVCDGSTDQTPEIVNNFRLQYRLISLKVHKRRLGKAARLNEIYEANSSDFLFMLDGDVVLGTRFEIENVLRVAIKTNAQVVAAHQVPLTVQGFTKRILYANHVFWAEVFAHVNGGNHIQNLQGSATLISREFARQIHYPAGIPCDQGYLYIKAAQRNAFAYSYANQVIFRPLGTLRDWNRLNQRILSERHTLEQLFGDSIWKLYSAPRANKLHALFLQLQKDPFFTTVAIGMSYFFGLTNLFQKPTVKGIWPTLTSTKAAIISKMTSHKRRLFIFLPFGLFNSSIVHVQRFHHVHHVLGTHFINLMLRKTLLRI